MEVELKLRGGWGEGRGLEGFLFFIWFVVLFIFFSFRGGKYF